jgi:hypothetical protein
MSEAISARASAPSGLQSVWTHVKPRPYANHHGEMRNGTYTGKSESHMRDSPLMFQAEAGVFLSHGNAKHSTTLSNEAWLPPQCEKNSEARRDHGSRGKEELGRLLGRLPSASGVVRLLCSSLLLVRRLSRFFNLLCGARGRPWNRYQAGIPITRAYVSIVGKFRI